MGRGWICYSIIMRKVYMDYAASAPIDKKVRLEMKRVSNLYANPGTIHKEGVKAMTEISNARKKIADVLYAHPDEIIFTGSATESIAIALLGTVYALDFKILNNKLPHIITTNIEHKSVLENCKILEKKNLVEVSYLEVDEKGILDPKILKKYLKENTILVSVGYANNEIGTIQNIQEIAKEIRHYRKAHSIKHIAQSNDYPLFHTDATQAINYLFIKNMEKLGVDMMSFNGAKIYGPKGIGVLYKKRGINISPLYVGGGQEFGLRPGTENIESILGIAKALKIAEKMKDKESIRLEKLRDIFIEQLKNLNKETGFKITINGDEKNRLPNNINISIDKISNELVLIELDAKGIMISTKSACGANDEETSHVIEAIKNKKLESLRFSLGRETKEKDILYVIKILKNILLKYKDML